jgi:hypothetical protein
VAEIWANAASTNVVDVAIGSAEQS